MNDVITEPSRIEVKFVANNVYHDILWNCVHWYSEGFTSPNPDQWVKNN
jgi:hypothetical protein